VAIAAEQKVEQLEIQLAVLLKIIKVAKYWQFMLERLMKDLSELKRQMRKRFLREDYRAERIRNLIKR
jgi:hypothetical protein